MSKAHVLRGKITSLCCPEIDYPFVFNSIWWHRSCLTHCMAFLPWRSAVSQEQRNQADRLAFMSGEAVPISGMWRSEHDGCFDPPDLWLYRSAPFPSCPRCGAKASFVLMEEVRHISEDPDFQ